MFGGIRCLGRSRVAGRSRVQGGFCAVMCREWFTGLLWWSCGPELNVSPVKPFSINFRDTSNALVEYRPRFAQLAKGSSNPPYYFPPWTIMVFIPLQTSRKRGLSPLPSILSIHFFFFSKPIFTLFVFSDRHLLELRSTRCPGIGNYKRYRIFRGISHTSNIVVLQTLELLEGWMFWR